ncbi:MAG TPA: Uma2 family endonuclease, partial [Kribbellaceae bacterium]|nr:Uma2 family endonuclease [Kribbellaceae bacterium]
MCRETRAAAVRRGRRRAWGQRQAVTTDLSEPLVFAAPDVLVACEIVSSWGQARDRILKPAMYAASGIGWYLLVEREADLELVLHRLDGERYTEHARARQGDRVAIPPLSVDVQV